MKFSVDISQYISCEDPVMNFITVLCIPSSSMRIFCHVSKLVPAASELSNFQKLILMDEQLNLCRSRASLCSHQEMMFYCLEPCEPHKYQCLSKRLLTKHLFNLCQVFCCSLPKIHTKFSANSLLLFFHIHLENWQMKLY